MNGKKRIEAIILAIFVMVLLIAFQMYKFNIKLYTSGEELMGTDPYTRMVRAQELFDGGDWYDSTMERSNSPYGEELHWTRPMDVIIVGGAGILEQFMEREKAFELSGLYVSLVLGVISVAAMLWAASYMFAWDVTPLALILFFSQLFVLQYFNVGRPDHHSLIILLFIVFFSGAFRLLGETQKGAWAIVAAVAAAIAFWVSVETIVLPALLALLLTVVWLIYGDDSMERLSSFSTILVVLTGIFLVIERPLSGLMTVEYDKISIPYFFLFAALAMFAFGGRYLRTGKRYGRILYTLISGSGLLYMLLRFYPEMIKGPFSGVNPEIVSLWLSKVNEVQSIFKVDIGSAISYVGLPLVGIISLSYFLIRRKMQKPAVWSFILLGLLIYTILGIYQIRWIAYAQILSVFPAVFFIKQIFIRIEKIDSGKLRVLLRAGTVLLLCMGFVVVSILYPSEVGKEQAPEEGEASLREVCEWMNLQDFGEEPVILAHIDAGPQILYRTHMRVIATPYHRNDEGILFYFNVMAEEDMEKLKPMLKGRSVELILQKIPGGCNDGAKEDSSFREKLMSGNTPDWINEVKLPEEMKGYRLYETLY